MKKKINRQFFTLCAAILLFFTAEAYAGSLTYLRANDSVTLDPELANDSSSNEVITNIYEGLVTASTEPLKFEPCLAERWEISNNGKRWVFFLRRGIKFHNGEALTSQAVADAFNRKLLSPKSMYANWKSTFPFLTSVKALDSYTVEFNFSKHYTPFLAALTLPSSVIPSPSCYNNKSRDSFTPIGTGPFKFELWEKNKVLVLKRNDQYWQNRVNVEKVIFKIDSNPSSRIMQLKNGNADLLKLLSSDEWDEFNGRSDIERLAIPGLQIHFLVFNTKKLPFSKLEARQAIIHLIRKEVLVKMVFQELAIPANTPIPPQLTRGNDIPKDYDYNPQFAKNALKKAGLSKGFTCNLLFSKTNPALQKVVDAIAENAKTLNIKINKTPLPFNQIVQHVEKGEHDLVLMGWVGGPDSYLFLYPIMANEKGSNNGSFYVNPTFSNLLEVYQSSVDSMKRKQSIDEAIKILHMDSPLLPLYNLKYIAVYRKNVSNLRFDVNGHLNFKLVVKSDK